MRGFNLSIAVLLCLMVGVSPACGGFGSEGGSTREPLPPILLIIQANPLLLPVPGKQNHFAIQVNQDIQLLAFTLNGLQVNDKVQWSQFPETPAGIAGTLNAQTGQFKAPGSPGTIRIAAIEKPGSDRQYNGHTYLDIVP